MHPILKKAKITNKVLLSPKVLEITISPDEEYAFIPGQFNSIKIGAAFRAYSVSSLVESNSFKSIVSIGHAGLGSNFFKDISIGTTIEFIGPNGRFYLSDRHEKNIILLATGTGLAPFIPMLESLSRIPNITSQVHLCFGARTSEELFYLAKLNTFKESGNWFDYRVCLSQEKNSQYITGRITENYTLKDPDNTQVYLCGHPEMVEENITRVSGMGVNPTNIFYEKFTTAVKKNSDTS